MGVWGLDIYDDDLAVYIKDEFQGYLDEGMDEEEAINEVISVSYTHLTLPTNSRV